MFAKVVHGHVELYDGTHSVPVVCFGHGVNIISVTVYGDEIFCNRKDGTTIVYEYTGSGVNQIYSFR